MGNMRETIVRRFGVCTAAGEVMGSHGAVHVRSRFMRGVAESKVPMSSAMVLHVGRDKAASLDVGSCRSKLDMIVRGNEGKGLVVGRKKKGI